MSHYLEIDWNEMVGRVALQTNGLRKQLEGGEQEYQAMLVIKGSLTASQFAGLLFLGDSGGAPTSEQEDKAQDLIDAMVAVHQLYQAANNVSITQADRLADFRKFQ